jgi:hypothetical protein
VTLVRTTLMKETKRSQDAVPGKWSGIRTVGMRVWNRLRKSGYEGVE